MVGFWVRLRDRIAGVLADLLGRLRDAIVREEPQPHPWLAAYPEGLSWTIDIEPKPLFTILDDTVASHPDHPCLYFLGKTYSYKEVGALVDKAAQGLLALGVAKGVKVGLFLPNSHYYVICYHAILKAGGTVVNFNPLYAEREVARQIRDSETRIMVTMDLMGLYPKVFQQLEDGLLQRIVVCTMSGALRFPDKALFTVFKRKEVVPIPADERHVRFDKLTANKGEAPAAAIDPHADIAVLQYTGGTTGLPKGAILTHANLYMNTMQTARWAREIETGAEKVLAVLPLFHVFGMTAVMNAALYRACEIVLLPRFKVSELLKTIDKIKPTVFFGVPTMFSAINARKDLDKFDLSSLKYCVSGGAPLPLEIKNTFERLSRCSLVEGYGLTEAGPVCTINPLSGADRPGSAGQPIPGTVIEVVSLDNPAKTVPIGSKGEICISGPQVMAGYWKQDGETEAVLTDGRLRTGDVGYIDEGGFIYLIDRIKDLIISGGYNVYPRMVEEAIYLHPAVAEVAVCGVPHKHHGEMVKAFITLCEGATLTGAELRSFLGDKLAPFEIPRRVEFIDEIPKTIIGKPLRRALVAKEQRKGETDDAQANGAQSDETQPDEMAARADAPGKTRERNDQASEVTVA